MEHGVLRPLQPLALSEHQHVTLIIAEPAGSGDDDSWRDADYEQLLTTGAGDAPSLDAVRAALATIPGSLTADFIAEREDR